MEAVFKYVIGLGAAVMMPVIFTILGVCIGIKLSKGHHRAPDDEPRSGAG